MQPSDMNKNSAAETTPAVTAIQGLRLSSFHFLQGLRHSSFHFLQGLRHSSFHTGRAEARRGKDMNSEGESPSRSTAREW